MGEAWEMFQRLDTNRDGTLSMEEFQRLWSSGNFVPPAQIVGQSQFTYDAPAVETLTEVYVPAQVEVPILEEQVIVPSVIQTIVNPVPVEDGPLAIPFAFGASAICSAPAVKAEPIYEATNVTLVSPQDVVTETIEEPVVYTEEVVTETITVSEPVVTETITVSEQVVTETVKVSGHGHGHGHGHEHGAGKRIVY